MRANCAGRTNALEIVLAETVCVDSEFDERSCNGAARTRIGSVRSAKVNGTGNIADLIRMVGRRDLGRNGYHDDIGGTGPGTTKTNEQSRTGLRGEENE